MLHVKHFRVDNRPNTIQPLSKNIVKLIGMKLLFIFGNVEYNRKTEGLKARVQVVFETRGRHRRSQEGPVSMLLVQHNKQKQNKNKTRPNDTKTRQSKKKKTQKNSIYLIIIPINKEMRSTRIQTAHLAGHFYKLTLWLLYADMYKFMAPVIKTCLYLLSERECLGGFFFDMCST